MTNPLGIIIRALEFIERSDDPLERRIAYILRDAIEREIESTRKADWQERHTPPGKFIINKEQL